MTMTDEELDRDWQPNGRRPQSTIARSFSQELMDIFRIENSISDLDSQVVQRKQTVNKNNEELAALEARIREMEERLRRNTSGTNSTAQQGGPSIAAQQAQLEVAKEEAKARSRPGTARASEPAPSSGNMPPTPGPSEDGDRD